MHATLRPSSLTWALAPVRMPRLSRTTTARTISENLIKLGVAAPTSPLIRAQTPVLVATAWDSDDDGATPPVDIVRCRESCRDREENIPCRENLSCEPPWSCGASGLSISTTIGLGARATTRLALRP
jgi:hypothetical protein